MSTSPAARMLTLMSSDGEEFVVTEAVALQCHNFKRMIEDDSTNDAISLFNVTGAILAKVIEYCSKHADVAASEDDLKKWDAQFVKVDQTILLDLLMAADYLNIKSLVDLTCQTVADMINGKTAEEIRQIFNIKNDFTPEEEEEVRRENQWAFE